MKDKTKLTFSGKARNFILAGAAALSISLIACAADVPPQVQLGRDVAVLAEAINPAVVLIKTGTFNPDGEDIEEFSKFLEKLQIAKPTQPLEFPLGAGSGFIISPDGYIITNHHVIEKAEVIHVFLADGHEYTAKLIGSDEMTDVALLKIDPVKVTSVKLGTVLTLNFPTAKLGNSETLRRGNAVFAVGAPMGLDWTITSGIISAVEREVEQFVRYIQTDAAVNPGNSGGPLFNSAGEVVGINTMIISKSGMFSGIAMAIPINDALKVVESIKRDGKVHRGKLSVGVVAVSAQMKTLLGLPSTNGALVTAIDPTGPSADLLKLADVVLEIDGRQIKKPFDLARMVASLPPQTKVQLTVWRNNALVTVTVKLGEL